VLPDHKTTGILDIRKPKTWVLMESVPGEEFLNCIWLTPLTVSLNCRREGEREKGKEGKRERERERERKRERRKGRGRSHTSLFSLLIRALITPEKPHPCHVIYAKQHATEHSITCMDSRETQTFSSKHSTSGIRPPHSCPSFMETHPFIPLIQKS